MFALEPRRADAQNRTATREHVERGDDLGQQAWVAVGDTGDQEPQRHRLGMCGKVTQRGVALEHVGLGGQARRLDLEEVVHERQPARPCGFGGLADTREFTGDRRGAAVDVEDRNVKTKVHGS